MKQTLDPAQIVDRYVAVWHEPDNAARRALIEVIWAEGGAHLSATKEPRNYDQLEERIANTYQQWVADEGYSFRRLGDVQSHHDAITFRWEMITSSGETDSIGRDLILIDDDGRMRCVYQFIEQSSD